MTTPPAPLQADRSLAQVTEARRAAAELCADLRRGELLDPAFDVRAAALDARDRRWLQELAFGMLRRRSALDARVAPRVTGGLGRLDADVVDLLRLGAYQLLHMRSVPPYAAIAQTVELVKTRHGIGASRLANAVLRRLDRERDDAPPVPADPVEALALAHSHPRWLVARWIARWGAEETARLLAANDREPPTVLRAYGVVPEQLEAMLESAGVATREHALVPGSLEVTGGAAFMETGAFRQGHCFVQDPGATLVARYAAVPAGSTVADLCAAPGGKALELARDARAVIACDRSAMRVVRLTQNVARVEAAHVHVVIADARHPAVSGVDAVLIDAPCTGTGTLRRHPDARWRLKPSDLAVMAALQRALLRAAAPAVRVGGLLIYSTCSLEPEENDAQVESFLTDQKDAFALEPPPEGAVDASTLDAGRLRVLPQRHGTDGAFAARLRRVA
jgi:16S rRNA (cytosine967-C5)-methyltransferase